MRSCVIALASLCVLGQPLAAQGLGAGVDYGVKAGPVFVLDRNNLSADPEDLGLTGGLFYDSSFESRAALQVDALLIWRQIAASQAYRSLVALEFPVLLRVNSIAGRRRGVAVFGVTGPSFDFTLRQPIGEHSRTRPYSTLNVNWTFGGGVEIDRLVLEGRYALGLEPLQGDSRFGEVVRLHSFTATIGMRLQRD